MTRNPETLAKWRTSMAARRALGPIDKSRCGLPRNTPQDVWKKIAKCDPDKCWEWTGSKDLGGYGMFRISGRYYKAHRIVYSIEVEPIGLNAPKNPYERGLILHTCDNRGCCNPKHLYRGNIWDNMRDKVDRNRTYKGGPRPKKDGIPRI